MSNDVVSDNSYRQWSIQIATHVVFAAFIILIGLSRPPVQSWPVILAATVVYFLAVGYETRRLWFAILIDSRNRVSLSRAQMIAWSIVILSGFAAAAFSNVSQEVSAPLTIAVPSELWIVMGISTTSLIGSPFLLDVKSQRPGDPIQVKANPQDASLMDMVRGEAEQNCDYVDLPKLQMGYFTIVIVLAYGAALAKLFANLREGEAVHSLPELDKGLLALMGISHTGYLAAKPMASKPSIGRESR